MGVYAAVNRVPKESFMVSSHNGPECVFHLILGNLKSPQVIILAMSRGAPSANDSIIVASVELGVFGARYTHLEACAASHIYSSNVLGAASLRISSPIFLDAHIRQPPLFSVIPSQPKRS